MSPVIYESALRSDVWHYLEHASFLRAALLFWYPVVRPEPSRPRWSALAFVPVSAPCRCAEHAFGGTADLRESADLSLLRRVPRLPGLSPLGDQAAAGVIMWVPGSVAFLVPLFAIGVRLLYPTRTVSHRPASITEAAIEPLGSTTSRFEDAAGLGTVRPPRTHRCWEVFSDGGTPAWHCNCRSPSSQQS